MICHTRHGGILTAKFASMHVMGQCCVTYQLAENGQQMYAAGARVYEAASRYLYRLPVGSASTEVGSALILGVRRQANQF